MTGSPVTVQTGAAPRGNGGAAANFQAQTMRGSFSWGGSPGTATLVYPGFTGTQGEFAGGGLRFWIGAHYFSGICKSDTVVSGSRGALRTLEFADLREFLTWDYIFGCFNKPDVRLVNGVRLKRWKHIYPADYKTYTWTFTNTPLPGWQILAVIFQAPTVGSPWFYDLTSNGLFPAGLLNWPVYDIDCLNGMRLDALLNLICEKTGLVFCHDPIDSPYENTDYRLVFTRKGFGLLPIPFPTNSDDQRLGLSLSGHATNICVLGDRNKYQVLEVPMVQDWSPAWEQFISQVDALAKDIFNHETNPLTGLRYNAYPNDPAFWIGANEAKARAQSITVAEYAALRNARLAGDGNQFLDNRKFAGRWRNDMLAALYLDKICFRAFKPDLANFPGVKNKAGLMVPLTSAEILDELLCWVTYDPLTGHMTPNLDSGGRLQPVDGNGVLIVKGYQVGGDLFRLVRPDRMNEDFFNAATALWAQTNFQIDDSGEGIRFVIADLPVFVPDAAHPLLVTVDGQVVLNAQFVLLVPPVKATLTFAAERYTYWKGTYPNVSKDRVENVGGLNGEWLVDTGGGYTEVVYANNETADQKADTIAASLLLAQYFYASGGYNLKWDPNQLIAAFGTPLAPPNSSCFDRIEITNGPNGCIEVVDFTTERERDRFEPERELDRRSIQNSLFPGQQELRVEIDQQRRFNSAIRKMPEGLFTLFRKLLNGEIDGNLLPTKFLPGTNPPATLAVGTPIWGVPQPAKTTPGNGQTATMPASVSGTNYNLIGVTVRHNESTDWEFPVQSKGDVPARVQGPVAVNDPIGLANGADYFIKGGTPGVGTVLQPISDSSITTVLIRLGTSGGGATGTGGDVWL